MAYFTADAGSLQAGQQGKFELERELEYTKRFIV